MGFLVLCAGVLLALGLVFWASRPDIAHVPLYPQARIVEDQQGAAVRAIYAGTSGALVPVREIIYDVDDGPDPVIDYYSQQLSRSNWQPSPFPVEVGCIHCTDPRPCARWSWPTADLRWRSITVCTDPPRFFDGRPDQPSGPTRVQIDLFTEPVQQIATATALPTQPWIPPQPTIVPAILTTRTGQ